MLVYPLDKATKRPCKECGLLVAAIVLMIKRGCLKRWVAATKWPVTIADDNVYINKLPVVIGYSVFGLSIVPGPYIYNGEKGRFSNSLNCKQYSVELANRIRDLELVLSLYPKDTMDNPDMPYLLATARLNFPKILSVMAVSDQAMADPITTFKLVAFLSHRPSLNAVRGWPYKLLNELN